MTRRVVVSDGKTADVATERAALADLDDVAVELAAAHDEAAVVDATAGADALIVDAGTPVSASVLEALDLTVVGRAGIGVDNVALEAAAAEGVTVVHVPDYCLNEVASHALSLLLACARGHPAYGANTRGGEWDWGAGRPLHRLPGSTLGLVAFGNVPNRLLDLAAGYDFEVLCYDPYVSAARMEARGVENVDFESLLGRADLLSLHAPLTEETESMLDAAAFDAMAAGTIVVNTARGPLVDTDALVDALDDGTVAAAGLDVLPEEPPADASLAARDDVIVTPHVAWYSEESTAELRRKVAEDVGRVLSGETPRAPVSAGDGW
jgi:D-3-phosphoglycerate dehydrogenase